MDKETFNIRRDWAKANIDKCEREVRDLKEKALRINFLIDILHKDKEMYRKYLDETWEQYIEGVEYRKIKDIEIISLESI